MSAFERDMGAFRSPITSKRTAAEEPDCPSPQPSIQPGKLQQNADIECYNRTVRGEWPGQCIFETIDPPFDLSRLCFASGARFDHFSLESGRDFRPGAE